MESEQSLAVVDELTARLARRARLRVAEVLACAPGAGGEQFDELLVVDIDAVPDCTWTAQVRGAGHAVLFSRESTPGRLAEALLPERPAMFSGWVAARGKPQHGDPVAVAIFDETLTGHLLQAPEDFSVVAFMIGYNEADIVEASIEELVEGGIEVHFIDNWSTDGTFERVRSLLGRGVRAVERFPAGGPTGRYEWDALLARVEVLAGQAEDDWCVLHDVDELREGPFDGLTYRDSLYTAGRTGFDAADHTVVEFRPVDSGFIPGSDFASYFRHFDFTRTAADRVQVKAWRNGPAPVDIRTSGGHDISFPGRRVFPYNFLLRHYPVRSQQHGEQKVFRDRKPRWTISELNRGWHYQYRSVRRGHRFVRDPTTLFRFDADFDSTFLAQRLFGIGVVDRPPTCEDTLRREAVAFLRRFGLLRSYGRLRGALRYLHR